MKNKSLFNIDAYLECLNDIKNESDRNLAIISQVVIDDLLYMLIDEILKNNIFDNLLKHEFQSVSFKNSIAFGFGLV